MDEVDVTEAVNRVRAGRAVLLDVREQDEWDRGHAPEAVHLPMSELAARQHEIPEGPILAVCHAGGRSARVTEALAQAGYDVTNVSGGMAAWERQGLPLVDGSGGPGRVDA